MLLQMLLLSIAIQLVMFIFAYKFQTDKLTDASYGAGFIILAAIALYHNFSYSSLILYCMILLWAFRLGSYLIMRIRIIGRDRRFDRMRGKFLNFLGFWSLQALTVWVVLIPTFFFMGNRRLSLLSILGALIFATGINIETIADLQKFRFKKKSDKWANEGLWKYSRHPNYFGEILVWIGIFVYTLPGLTRAEAFVGLASPLFIAFLLLYVSGIPLIEKRWEKKWGRNKEFRDYMDRTSVLIPWSPGK